MMYKALIFSILLVSVVTILTPVRSLDPPLNDDVLGLIVFKADLRDPEQKLASWNEDDYSPCSWNGVKCHPRTNRVTELTLDGFSLSGRIGRGLLQLQSLHKLSLSNNNLTGIINPNLLLSLVNLKVVDLSSNELSGSIPDGFFRQCGSLRAFSLAKNKLTGKIPVSISSCSSLASLNLSSNRFTGLGGDSIYKFLYGEHARFFGDEIHLDLKHSKTGTVAMASGGENLNASQFYFTLRDDLDYLDGKHTVFGEIAEGLDTLTRINEAYVDAKNRPFKNIRIKHTHILEDPFVDPPQLADMIPDASPKGKPKEEVELDVRLEDDWVPMDEELGAHELDEFIREKAAHSSAVVLESIGDIPEAEVKPPDNVLFVCKLNPVTEG